MLVLHARYTFNNSWYLQLQLTVRNYNGRVGGWLDQLKIKLTSVPAGLKLELGTELGKKGMILATMKELDIHLTGAGTNP